MTRAQPVGALLRLRQSTQPAIVVTFVVRAIASISRNVAMALLTRNVSPRNVFDDSSRRTQERREPELTESFASILRIASVFVRRAPTFATRSWQLVQVPGAANS